MSSALRKPMTQDAFFAWAEGQDRRYEFDGFRPVAMTGGTVNHGTVADNIRAELRQRLRGTACRVISPDGAGVETVDNRVRYPEATVTCSPLAGTARKVSDPVVVFEVVSESTLRIDQVFKLREYHAVPSIRRYILVEQIGIALTVHTRQGGEPWATTTLGKGETLLLLEIGIENSGKCALRRCRVQRSRGGVTGS